MGDDMMTAEEARALLVSHELTGNGRTLAARALRAVIALHEAAATKERHAAFYMRQALPDAWERVRDAPEPEWPEAPTGDAPAPPREGA